MLMRMKLWLYLCANHPSRAPPLFRERVGGVPPKLRRPRVFLKDRRPSQSQPRPCGPHWHWSLGAERPEIVKGNQVFEAEHTKAGVFGNGMEPMEIEPFNFTGECTMHCKCSSAALVRKRHRQPFHIVQLSLPRARGRTEEERRR